MNNYSQINSLTFNSNGNITIPIGVTNVTVQAWGGGGGGDNVATLPTQGTGGGGGGAYTSGVVPVVSGQTYNVTVGAGGGVDTNGGNSTFQGISARGGQAANGTTGGAGGTASAITGNVNASFRGGNGGNGGNTFTGPDAGGGGGGSANTNGNGGTGIQGGNNSNTLTSGGIGTGNGGGGGATDGSPSGQSGFAPGGGGGGKGDGGGTPGSGANGRVVITWYIPEIDVLGLNGATISDGSNTLNTTIGTLFANADILTGSNTQTFTIKNEGNASLTISNISISGSHAGDFSITANASSPVAALGFTTFTLTFNPSAIGNRNALITIYNNDPNGENEYTFAIRGVGESSPEIDIRGNGNTITDGSTGTSFTNATNFGPQYINGGSTTTIFTIYNLGSASLAVTPTITIGGTHPGDFTVVASPASSIAIGGFTTFTIKFDPNATGNRSATISIVNSDSNENPYNFAISGTGNLYRDSDSDGVTDDLDIDDDNDGILDTLEQAACLQSATSGSAETVFLHDTFGTGTSRTTISTNITTATTQYSYAASGDIGDGSYAVVNKASSTSSWGGDYWWTGSDHTGDLNGKMALFNGDNVAGKEFYATLISGLTPGIPMKYSFWVINLDRANNPMGNSRPKPNITVKFFNTVGGALIATMNTNDIAQNTSSYNWVEFSQSLTPTQESIKVVFTNNSPGGAGNDLALDDIKITQTYCDMDRDQNPDIFDLDDDNDGIADIVEAGFRAYSANKSRMDLSNPTLWSDANGNGMNDVIDPTLIGNQAYMAMIKDSDADGIYDFMDLDSDNDSLFDVDEAQQDNFSTKYNGDADIDGDGISDGVDSDGDGIMDAQDDLHGYGTTFAAYPDDSDGDGRPDYSDTSNGGLYDINKVGIFSHLDANNDGRIDSTTDIDKDGIMDSLDGDTATAGSPRNLTGRKYLIDFDGRNDYVEGTQILSAKTRATIMAWFKLDAAFTNSGQIAGQDNFIVGVNASKQLYVTAGGQTATYTTPLATNRWYHASAVYSGGSSPKVILYINGLSVASSGSSSTTALAASSAKFTIGKSSGSSSNYFRGYIDEVRIFDEALSQSQLSPMICQEIKQNGSSISGELVQRNFSSISWSNLIAYYRLDNFKDDVADNHITSSIDAGNATTLARAYNIKYIRPQTAPMPFITNAAGNIETNVANITNYVYGPTTVEFPAAIINVKHNTIVSDNHMNAGLIIDTGKTLTVINDSKIENSWHLQLDGKLDLEGKSQLVQTSESTIVGTGTMERDQQGTSNGYNYNYWSSPVSTVLNGGCSVNAVMKNGTVSTTPVSLQWTGSPDAVTVGNEIQLSNIWIYKYQSDSAGWEYMGPNGQFLAGQGYTLKGSNSSSPTQNYVFSGVPNNGLITVPVASGSLSVVGNPYPSALNVDEFIKDNLPVGNLAANPGTSGALNGNLYFWEHAATNNSHYTAAYQGSYAARNLVGYTLPVAADGTAGTGGNTKYAREFIPVGQGFFVQASPAGGNITFKNSQRAFHKEDSQFSNPLFRNANAQPQTETSGNDAYDPPQYGKIRLGFITPDNYHRQILLGFMQEYATDGYELGYDAENFDTNPSDMTFLSEGKNLIIQGVGYFSEDAEYMLSVKIASAAPVKFRLDQVENLDPEQNIYIYDHELLQYHNLKTGDFEITLDPAVYNARFSLKFTDQQLDRNVPEKNTAPALIYSEFNRMISIRTHVKEPVQSVILYSLPGQEITRWKVNEPSSEVSLQVGPVAAGTYIAKILTAHGHFSRKIMIR